MRRKSQAAMEFMLTYGWAITVVVVAISALAYFGVLDMGKYAPSMCTLPAGLSCLDHGVSAYSDFGTDYNRLELNVKNNIGWDIQITEIKIAQFNDRTEPLNIEISNGRKTGTPGPPPIDNIIVDDLNNGLPVMLSGEKYEIEFTISYTHDESGLPHTVKGTVTGKVS